MKVPTKAPEVIAAQLSKADEIDRQLTDELDLFYSYAVRGDLSNLTDAQKAMVLRRACAALDLDPITQPFDIVKEAGKETLYLRAHGFAQLSARHHVCGHIVSREETEDAFKVVYRAVLPSGRFQEAIGTKSKRGKDGKLLVGQSMLNCEMTAETKARRRATLALLGYGIGLEPDEIDRASYPEHVPAALPAATQVSVAGSAASESDYGALEWEADADEGPTAAATAESPRATAEAAPPPARRPDLTDEQVAALATEWDAPPPPDAPRRPRVRDKMAARDGELEFPPKGGPDLGTQ